MTIQVLRTIDKFDKIGRDGVVALLQKPADEFGAGLDPIRAELVGRFLDTKGASNAETLDAIKGFLASAGKIRTRMELLEALESTTKEDGRTGLDLLLALRPNEDQSWANGGRPENIAWALDDLVEASVAD